MAYPRKPTNLKVLEGTFRKDRANPDEPEYPIEIPGCPPQLSKAGKAEWRRIVPLLEAAGLISKVSRAELAAYCAFYARWIKAEKEIEKDGEMIKVADMQKGSEPYPRDKETGELIYFIYRKNPWLDISFQCAAEMRKFASGFGLSPASKTKVKATIPKKEVVDPRERFFK